MTFSGIQCDLKNCCPVMEGALGAFYLLRNVLDETGDLVDFEFADLNERGAALIKMRREEVIGQRMCELLPVNRTHGFFEKYKQVAVTKEPLQEEFAIDQQYVAARWLRHQVTPVPDGIVIFSQDITTEKNALQSLRRDRVLLERILSNSPTATVVVNKSLQIRYANPKAEEMLSIKDTTADRKGIEPNEWFTTQAEGETFNVDPEFLASVWHQKSITDLNIPYELPTRKELEISIDAIPLPPVSGKTEGAILLITDRSLERHLQGLEEEISQVERMNPTPSTSVTSRVFRSETLKNQFPQIFELQVRNYTELIRSALEQKLSGEKKSHRQRIEKVAGALGNLGAGPKDLIDIHTEALRQLGKSLPPNRFAVASQESRLVSLEAMGCLVNYYRTHFSGV